MIAAVVTSAGLLGGLFGGAFPRIMWADLQARGDATGEIDTRAVVVTRHDGPIDSRGVEMGASAWGTIGRQHRGADAG